jgi:hypothetical protein
VLLLAMLVMCATASVSTAATPSWYPQLQFAVLDAGDAGAAIAACTVPAAATPKAGHTCAMTHASEASGVLDRVSVYAETGEVVGPCKRLLLEIDHTSVAGAQDALDFATNRTPTMAKDIRGRHGLEQAATHVGAEFAALKHCLGKA